MSIALAIVIIVTFSTVNLTYANVPIGGAAVMAFPLVSLLPTWGMSLIAAILIEMLVLKRKLDVKCLEAGKLSLYANLFSTLIGAMIAGAYSSFIALLIFSVPASILLLKFFNVIRGKTGFLRNFKKIKILGLLPFIAIGVIGLFLGGLLTPKLYRFFPGQEPSQSIKIISFCILLTLGYIITFLAEGFIIARCRSGKSNKIVAAVVSMNLISYAVLLPIFILSVRDEIFQL